MPRLLMPIGHCSKRLRRKLEIEEEQALAWRIKVRRRDADDGTHGNSKKGGRWHNAPNFAVPGPFGNRPVSPDGKVSFHFAITIVSRSGNGKSVVADSRGRTSETDRSPGDFDEYIAREGAVMTIDPYEFDQYAARHGLTDVGMGGVALMSNISLDPAERERYWKAVQAAARKAGPDRLILDPARGSKKEWRALAAAENAPSDIRQIAAQFASGERKRKAEFPMSEAEAKATIELICQSIPGADRKKGPVRFCRGRKGRTQYRLETELPDGLDSAARVRIMIKVARALDATGAMYTITLHRPDEHNDIRNFHLHIVANDRPARLIDGQWDFTIATPVEGQTGRMSFKERRKKIVIPSLITPSNRGDFGAFLKNLRVRYADFCNEELEKLGKTRLLDPRTYSEMGIDRKPTKPLGTRLAPLEAVGVPTKIGTGNAEIIWTYELQIRLRRCDADRTQRGRILADLAAAIERLAPGDPKLESARTALESAVQAAAFLDVVEPELAEYEVTLEMARARPKKVIDTCSRILTELEAGGGSSTDRRNRSRIAHRLEEATSFLRDIDRIDRANQKVIANQQPMIEQARQELTAASACLAGLEARSQQPLRSSAGSALPPPSITTEDISLESRSERSDVPPRTLALDKHAAASKAVHADPSQSAPLQSNLWKSLETIIARIEIDRLIVLGPEHHDGDGYRVGGVTREELRVLRHPQVADRAQLELARVAREQAREIDAAHFMYQSQGVARAKAAAAAGGDRPSTIHNPLGVLLAYREHPRAAFLMGWDIEEPVERTGKPRSIWRRMRTSVRQVFSGPETSAPEVQLISSAPDSAGAWTPVLPRSLDADVHRPGPYVEDAIAEYAKVVRTNPDVSFIIVEGVRRVDPLSIPDWERSVHAFEDHDIVLTAINDRWEEDQRKLQETERKQAATEKFRAAKRAQILASLEVGELTARQEKDGWTVYGRDEDLVFFANHWIDHPQLVAEFQKIQVDGPIADKRRMLSSAASPKAEPITPTPAPAAQPARHTPAPILPAESQAQRYTLNEQKWVRDTQGGGMGH